MGGVGGRGRYCLAGRCNMGANCGNIKADRQQKCTGRAAKMHTLHLQSYAYVQVTGESRPATAMKKKMKMRSLGSVNRLGLLLFFIFPLSSRRIGPSSPRRKDQMSLGSVAQEKKELHRSLLYVEEADPLTVSLDSCVPDTVR